MEKRAYPGNVVIMIATKRGSAYETEEQSGITHFIEHMLFSSNQHRSSREIIEELEFTGAEINAFTNPTITVFGADTFPQEACKTIDIVYEAVLNNHYDQDEFYREMQNILSEIKSNNEEPLAHLYHDIFMPTLFEGTPLKKKITGTLETVSRLTPGQLVEYKREVFLPNQPMVIIINGKYDEAEIVSQVEKTFGSLPRGISKPFPQITHSNKKRRKIKKKKEISQAYLGMGFSLPSQPHKDVFKLALLQSILGGGMSSRLFRELRDKRGIGYNVYVELESLETVGSLCFGVTVDDPGRLDEAEEIIKNELDNLKVSLVEDRELERAKKLLINTYKREILQPKTRAVLLMMQEFQKNPYDFRKFEYYIQRLSAKTLREVAKKYFSDQYVFCALIPE